jgi:DNA end-binding protein Ku
MSGSTSPQINGPLFSNGGPQSTNLDIHSESDSITKKEAVEYCRVRQVLQSDDGGQEVARHELVKGYEYGPGRYVAIEPAEYEKAAVETSDSIELFHFVKSDEVDPVYFERSYYVVPEVGGERAYALLLKAMQNQGCWGVARIGMHKREHILILRTTEKGITAHTMFYANEVRKAPEFHTDPGLVREQELTVAEALIKGYFGSFEPQKFHDIYQQRLQDLIQAGLRSTPEPAISASRPNAIVPDLMEELKRSLFQIQKKPAKPVEQKTIRGKSKGRNKVSYA